MEGTRKRRAHLKGKRVIIRSWQVVRKEGWLTILRAHVCAWLSNFEREREILVYLSAVHNSWALVKLKPLVWNTICVSYVGCKDLGLEPAPAASLGAHE